MKARPFVWQIKIKQDPSYIIYYFLFLGGVPSMVGGILVTQKIKIKIKNKRSKASIHFQNKTMI